MEWFVQESHRAGVESSCARTVICVRGNEDDWNLPFGRDDLMLQIEAAHAGHSDVENQASGLPRLIRIQKRLRRSETLCLKSDRSDQIVERIPKSVVIVDDRNERSTGHTASFSSLGYLLESYPEHLPLEENLAVAGENFY